MKNNVKDEENDDWSHSNFQPGDLVYVQEWDCDPKTGVVIGIDGEWDDGEPPGLEWTTYLEIQFQNGEISFCDERMCSHIEE